MDRQGNVCVPFGKLSFAKEALLDNVNAVIEAVKSERPSAAKGQYIKTMAVASTMGIGVRVTVKAEAAE